MKNIAIVLPAYNESKVISTVINDLHKNFKTSPYNYKIIVVDDGSTDSTFQKAIQNNVYVIRHVLNTGSGGATATGLSYANQYNFDIACTIDADGQHTANDLLRGVNHMMKNYGKMDLLIGSRLINNNGMSRLKLFGNKSLSLITYLLFGINVTDSQSGLRIFSKKALRELKWKTSGYEYCSEMLWRARQLNLQIDEYPIETIYTEYSKTKGQNNWNGFNIVKTLLQRRVVEMFGE